MHIHTVHCCCCCCCCRLWLPGKEADENNDHMDPVIQAIDEFVTYPVNDNNLIHWSISPSVYSKSVKHIAIPRNGMATYFRACIRTDSKFTNN